MTDARTPSDHHQDAQDALVEDRSMRPPNAMRAKHKHEFHALWWHLGQYGRQDIHLHPCATPSCEVELVGFGHSCGGPSTEHVRKRLTSATKWQTKAKEGAPMTDHRYRRDFHHHETEEEARDRNAAEDFEESGGLEREGLALLRREQPWSFTESDDNPREADRRCFGRDEADNPSGDEAA